MSPDGQYVAISANGGDLSPGVFLADLRLGKLFQLRKNPDADMGSVDWQPDGHFFIVAVGGTAVAHESMTVFNAASRQYLGVFEGYHYKWGADGIVYDWYQRELGRAGEVVRYGLSQFVLATGVDQPILNLNDWQDCVGIRWSDNQVIALRIDHESVLQGKEGAGYEPAPATWEEFVSVDMNGGILRTWVPYKFSGTVDTDVLRIRSAPSLDASTVGTLKQGVKVWVKARSDARDTIDGYSSYWYKIETPDGKTGWCFGHYIRMKMWPYDISRGTFNLGFDGRFVDGTPEEVRAAIQSWRADGRDIKEYRNESGVTVLMMAAWNNPNPGSILELLKAGAKVDDQADHGLTPLTFAASYNQNPAVVSALLEAGAKIDGETLYLASNINPNPEVILTLVKAGADVNYHDKGNGMTPLMAAGSNKNPEITSVLLKAGAQVENRDQAGETPLMRAAWSGGPQVVSILLKVGAKVNDVSSGGFTPLMYAAEFNGNPEVVSLLLKAGADGRLRSNEGQTAFECAQRNASLKDTKQYEDLRKAQY